MEPIPSEEPLQARVEPKMNRADMQTHAQVREGRKREGETGEPKTPPKISLLFLWYSNKRTECIYWCGQPKQQVTPHSRFAAALGAFAYPKIPKK